MKGCGWFLLTIILAVQTVFLTLKIMGTIDWSWWYVMLPLIVLYLITVNGCTVLVFVTYVWFFDKKDKDNGKKV